MTLSLSSYFIGIGAKRLSEVEIRPKSSNQHEFNGISDFKSIFGTTKLKFKGKFIFLSNEELETIDEEGTLTWYDAREDHPTRTEFRLYYSSNDVISSASPGDLLIIGRIKKDELIVIIAPKDSTTERQLLWLFNLAEVENKFIVKDLSKEKGELGFAAKHIISTLGLEIEETAPDYLKTIIKKFGESFPPTSQFSDFARSTLTGYSVEESPDEALLLFVEREELLFKTLEKHLVQEKLKIGFGKDGVDVEQFIQFSLSIQNRRKARAGLGFENHIEFIFKSNRIKFIKKVKTERNNEPDFLFPGIKEYKDKSFKEELLTMLAVKTTLKDRWRQVTSEADRIWPKHLITLEPSISKNQTDEIKAQKVQLVLPKGLIQTYTKEQQVEVLPFNEFIKLLKKKQQKYLGI